MPTNDLFNFMQSATRQMADDYSRIQKRATEDPGTAGDQGEENWAELLRNWLPNTFHIVTKGRIVGYEGDASPQVDVLILQPEYPKHLLNQKLYLAGGVLAAFECKVTLKAQHIVEFITTNRIVKDKAEERFGTPYNELQSRITFGLLAHSHSWKGANSKPIDNIESSLKSDCDSLVLKPSHLPDLICIADTACWSVLKFPFMGPSMFPPEYANAMEHLYGKDGCIQTTITRHQPQSGDDYVTPIGALITGLIHKLAWEVPGLRPLARYFEQVELKGNGYGGLLSKKWPLEHYSDCVKNSISGLRAVDRWSEWARAIY